jgi:tetratricopeptide (TPR) repeat protein
VARIRTCSRRGSAWAACAGISARTRARARPSRTRSVAVGRPLSLPRPALPRTALERAGRANEAARAYEEALALEPQSQAAALALSHLRLSSGDAAGARRVLEQALAHAGRRAESDPYWIYRRATPGHR